MAKQVAEELKPTTGAAMREMREQGVLQLFPSGNMYQVRTVGPAPLLRRGSLPNILLNFVVDAIYNGMNQEKLDGFMALQEKAESALGFLESLRIVCEEVFVSPKIVSDPTADDEVSMSPHPTRFGRSSSKQKMF